jgi:hypothetical protein
MTDDDNNNQDPSSSPSDGSPTSYAYQAHTAALTLLAEEQRTANLLALLSLPSVDGVSLDSMTRTQALHECVARLGLVRTGF